MNIAKLQIKRINILFTFKRLGFRGRTAFYNVCKSIDVTLSSLDIINFYDHEFVSENLVTKMEGFIEKLKNE